MDRSNNGPGLRAVIAVGLRAKGSRNGIDAQDASSSGLIDQVAQQQITVKRAKLIARSIRRSFDIIPTLQANFAFTRAYVAESSGKSGGFLGPNIFLETKVFRSDVPSWIIADEPFDWIPEHTSLATRFIALHGFRNAGHVLSDFRSGNEIYPMLQLANN